MEPLFITDDAYFEKEAGMLTSLSDNADSWNSEILSEAFNQVPFLSEFQVTADLIRADEKGFGYGALAVSSLPKNKKQAKDVKTAIIPVVIRDSKMDPLDTFIFNETYYPLTERRLRAALFQPETFSGIGERPQEAGLHNLLQPPLDTTKYACALLKLDGNVSQDSVEMFAKQAQAASLQLRLKKAPPGVQAAFKTASSLQATSLEDLNNLKYFCPPDTIQITKQANNYKIKWANSELYDPQETLVDKHIAQKLLTTDFHNLEKTGSILFSTKETNLSFKQKIAQFGLVDRLGTWVVQDVVGKQLAGMVLPIMQPLTEEGNITFLFVGGDQFCVQSQIAGKYAGENIALPEDPFAGFGVLYRDTGEHAFCLPPMKILGQSSSTEEEVVYLVYLPQDDIKLYISFYLELEQPEFIDNVLCLPISFKWMQLEEDQQIQLISNPDDILIQEKQAELISDGSCFSLRGPATESLELKDRSFLNKTSAEFLLGALGVATPQIPGILKKAQETGHVSIFGDTKISTHKAKVAESKQKLSSLIGQAQIPQPKFLLKEAAVLPDTLTVDKVLSLGFLTPENIATFVELIPEFEKTVSALSELLVSIRLGISDVPEVAVERAIRALDATVSGLNRLRNKEQEY